MRLRRHQRTVVGWNRHAIAAGKYGGLTRTRPTRIRRFRRWLRIGALLTIIGVMRFARGLRAHWEPLLLLLGVLLLVCGYYLPGIGLFFPGFLVITVTLLKGNSDRWRGARPSRPKRTRTVEPPISASYWAAVHSRTSYRPARWSEGRNPR